MTRTYQLCCRVLVSAVLLLTLTPIGATASSEPRSTDCVTASTCLNENQPCKIRNESRRALRRLPGGTTHAVLSLGILTCSSAKASKKLRWRFTDRTQYVITDLNQEVKFPDGKPDLDSQVVPIRISDVRCEYRQGSTDLTFDRPGEATSKPLLFGNCFFRVTNLSDVYDLRTQYPKFEVTMYSSTISGTGSAGNELGFDAVDFGDCDELSETTFQGKKRVNRVVSLDCMFRQVVGSKYVKQDTEIGVLSGPRTQIESRRSLVNQIGWQTLAADIVTRIVIRRGSYNNAIGCLWLGSSTNVEKIMSTLDASDMYDCGES